LKHEALINAMKIFGSKAVITATPTTSEELLTDSEEAFSRSSCALNLNYLKLPNPWKIWWISFYKLFFSNE
jgi:hypothetical protein